MASSIPSVKTIIGSEFPKKVIPLIDNAKVSIKIIVFDWRWYPQDPANPCQLFNQSIVRARRRGVKIKVIANNDEIVRVLNKLGCQAKKLVTRRLVHTKSMIIDNKILITGSHNYTQSAFQMNFETSLIIENESTIKRFDSFFNNLF